MRKNIDLHNIVETAARKADEEGLEHVTLSSVAKELGIKSPSLYNHVDGLSGLRKQMALHALATLRERMMAAAFNKTGKDAIISVSKAYVKYATEHPGLYEAFIMTPDDEDEEVKEQGDQLVGMMFRLLEPYDFSETEQVHIVRGIRSINHGFAVLEAKQGFKMNVNPGQSLEFVLRIFLAGLDAGSDGRFS
ncbi:TetR/AcrR family transcriptional regulator [Marinicrinis lubricantis]|uniref:TetR/AcrR family transcriptional regulator n=1 Tax=Marinicrinis lubricantis TaxID=2086470 RepID=A0ABW1IQC3_9BACL